MKKRTWIMTLVVFLLLVGLVVGIAAFFTNCFTGTPKPFLLTMGDKVITTDTHGVYLPRQTRFTVVSSDDFTVAVYPYASDDNAFAFTVGEESYTWAEAQAKDFTAAFGIEKQQDSFTVNYGTLKEMFRTVFPAQEVSFASDFGNAETFRLIVTSGKSSITLWVSIDAEIPVERIELSAYEIVF